MSDPVYEIRIYNFNIRGNREFSQRLDQKFWDKRCEYSEVIGMWRTELNGLFEYIHIAKFDDLDHLFRVRQGLQNDKQWSEYLMPLADLQWTFQNALLTPLTGSTVSTDIKRSDTALYELQTVPEGSKMLELDSSATLVGRFSTVYGKSKTEYRLIHYPNPSTALRDAMRNRHDLPVGSETRLMVPCSISPLH